MRFLAYDNSDLKYLFNFEISKKDRNTINILFNSTFLFIILFLIYLIYIVGSFIFI